MAVHRMRRRGPRMVGRRPAQIRLVMRARVLLMAARRQRAGPIAAPAEEGHEHEPPAVERGERSRDVDAPERVSRAKAVGGEGCLDDRVLRHEASEADRDKRSERNADAGQGERADHHGPESEWHLCAQPAHAAHVLFVVHPGDDRAGAQEQERLEECVGEEMENAEAVAADAEGGEHVAELRTGRIGDYPLDVVLHEADGGGEKSGRRSDDENDAERGRRHLEQGRQARHHEHAGGHHRRGVDEGRDRGRAFHRVGKPGVEQELGRLAHRSHEKEEADERRRVPVETDEIKGLAGEARRGGEHMVESYGAGQHKSQKDAERKAEVADAVDYERLDRRGVG